MSRPDTGEGFAVMDVSTAILDDEKFQQLSVQAPELYDPAFVGFMATLSRSWKKGRRVSVHDAWPKYRPLNTAAIEELIKVHLLDAKGCIPARPWREWFGPARKRRDESRERWRLAQQTRRERLKAESESPRAVSDDARSTPPSSPTTVRPSVPSVPSVPSEPNRSERSTRPQGFSERVARPGMRVVGSPVDPERTTA